ncbi:hypothetical protein QQP08_023777 [Theobroma cacao]|nr:hypothetical protein QQP08_023777 [Theobroma cacao]
MQVLEVGPVMQLKSRQPETGHASLPLSHMPKQTNRFVPPPSGNLSLHFGPSLFLNFQCFFGPKGRALLISDLIISSLQHPPKPPLCSSFLFYIPFLIKKQSGSTVLVLSGLSLTLRIQYSKREMEESEKIHPGFGPYHMRNQGLLSTANLSSMISSNRCLFPVFFSQFLAQDMSGFAAFGTRIKTCSYCQLTKGIIMYKLNMCTRDHPC